MGQFFINTDLESDERYDLAKFLEWNTDNYDVLTSRFLNDLDRNLLPTGTFEVRTEASRIDLVSNKIYGSTQFWWIILFFNGILDTEDFDSGDNLEYPELSEMEDKFFALKALETTSGG